MYSRRDPKWIPGRFHQAQSAGCEAENSRHFPIRLRRESGFQVFPEKRYKSVSPTVAMSQVTRSPYTTDISVGSGAHAGIHSWWFWRRWWWKQNTATPSTEDCECVLAGVVIPLFRNDSRIGSRLRQDNLYSRRTPSGSQVGSIRRNQLDARLKTHATFP